MSTTVVTVANPTNDEAAKAADAAALARADGVKPADPAKKFAGRYDSVEDLEKGYRELQAELTRRSNPKAAQQAAASEPPAQPQTQSLEIEKPNAPDADAAAAELASKGLNFDELAESFEKNGKVTEEDYARLEKAGISRARVDVYIAGVEALRRQNVEAAATLVGGMDTFNAIKSWASQTLTEAEATAYNEAVVKGGEAQKLALLGLKARYEAENGREARLVSGNSQANVQDGFKSYKEMSQAMADKRYGRDPVYTKSVEDRAKRSQF